MQGGEDAGELWTGVAFLAEDGLRCGAAGIDNVEPTGHAGEKKLSKMDQISKLGDC